MTLPTSFVLVNRKWKVKFVSERQLMQITGENKKIWGCCSELDATIYLNDELRQHDPELLYHTFEHELIHAQLMAHGIVDHDECFVDGMAGIRRQYLKTMRGNLE